MDTFEVVRRLRARQQAILGSLPPDLLTEFQEIESAIRYIDTLILKEGAGVQLDIGPRLQTILEQPEGGNRRPSRVPLAQRRMELRVYLQSYGPASRGQILMNTKMPPGTLSALLTEDEFGKNAEGLWQLRDH